MAGVLHFQYNAIRDELTVEGVTFAGDFFRFFALAKTGAICRITDTNGLIGVEVFQEEKPTEGKPKKISERGR